MKPVWNFKIFHWAVLVFSLTACTKKATNDESRFSLVQKQDVVQRTSLNGTLRGLRQTQVQPGYSGYVGKIYVKVGQKVTEGQPLVRITQTIDQPLSEVYPIKAPFAGTVTQILRREGEYVAGGSGGGSGSGSSSAILMLNDLRELWVDANVPEVDVAKVSIGSETLIRANALPGKTYKGQVHLISLSPRQAEDRWDRGRVEYPIEIRVINPDDGLKPGMTVVVDVISAKAEGVLAVRHEFVHRDDSGLYLVDVNGHRHDIETGLSNEAVVEIRSGVSEGLKVQMMDFSQQ